MIDFVKKKAEEKNIKVNLYNEIKRTR